MLAGLLTIPGLLSIVLHPDLLSWSELLFRLSFVSLVVPGSLFLFMVLFFALEK